MTAQQSRARAKLCRNHFLGYCPQGDQCRFLHPLLPPTTSNYMALEPLVTVNADGAHLVSPIQPPMFANWWPPAAYHNADASWPAFHGANPDISVVPPSRYKPLSWRTALCRHFTKNGGWCPLGDECNFIHDLTLAEYAREDVRFISRDTSSGHDRQSKAGTKHSHCWAYVQGLCQVKDCPYLHPVQLHRFVQHTPCLAWPNCTRGTLCPFKHPEPIIPKVQALPWSPEIAPGALTTLPIPVQFHGTTYFPQQPAPQLSSVANPALPTSPSAVYSPHVYGHTHAFRQGADSPPWDRSFSVFSPDVSSVASTNAHDGQGLFSAVSHDSVEQAAPWRDDLIYEADPFAVHAPAPAPSPAPSVPVPHMPPPTAAAHSPLTTTAHNAPHTHTPAPPAAAHASAAAAPSPSTSRPAQPAADVFPYVAPQVQRAGHARRVSVALKSREDADALGLFAAPAEGAATPRAGWQGHGSRRTRKSWAPASSASASFL